MPENPEPSARWYVFKETAPGSGLFSRSLHAVRAATPESALTTHLNLRLRDAETGTRFLVRRAMSSGEIHLFKVVPLQTFAIEAC